MLATFCTTLLLALSPSSGGDAEVWLARLESEAAADRDAAERWLAANLVLEDFGAVHAAALDGGAEGNRRLVSVLASSERHFGLAALLGLDEQQHVAFVGRESLLEQASAWSIATEKRGARRSEVVKELDRRAPERFTVEPRAHELADVLELLTIASDGGVMIVLDPDLLGARNVPEIDRRTAKILSGNQGELLSALARSYSLGFDGFGLDDEGDMAWIRVCRRLRAGKQSGRELLVDWSLGVLRGEDPVDREACARALAGSGWPAAIAWLEELWLKRGDEAALTGLRLLASRGLVSPRLRSSEMQATWLAPVRTRGTLTETARALGALGRIASNGEDLEPALLENWENLRAEERWLRLVALELRGSSGDRSRDQVLSVLRDPRVSSALAYQALQTASAVNFRIDGALAPQRIADLFEHADRIDEGRELVQLLVRQGVEPGSGLKFDGRTPTERLALCEWYFLAGKPEAGQLLKRLASETGLDESPATNPVVSRLREWQRAGQSSELAAWLSALEQGAPRLGRIRIHLGLLDQDEANSTADELLSKVEGGEDSPANLESLAALVACSRGPRIQALLVERETALEGEGIGEAADEVVRVLREKRLDSRLDSFARQVRRPGWPQSWPPSPGPRASPLRLFERRFEP